MGATFRSISVEALLRSRSHTSVGQSSLCSRPHRLAARQGMAPKKRTAVWKGDGLLVEEKEAGAAARRSRKQLQRRATDEQVERSLADNFTGWSTLETHGNIVGRKSLAQRIADDKRGAKASSKRLGSSYGQELREMYASSTTLASGLKVLDNRQSVSDTLVEAIKFSNCANLTKRTKAPLLTYLSSCKSTNQRALCGWLRHLVTIRLAASSAATGLVLEAMRCLKRLKVGVQQKSTVDVVHTLSDEALASADSGMRREGIPTANFREVHGDIASMVVDGPAVGARKCSTSQQRRLPRRRSGSSCRRSCRACRPKARHSRSSTHGWTPFRPSCPLSPASRT